MSKTAESPKNLRLTQRDINITTLVYEFLGCSIDQIARRFWKNTQQNAGARSAWYRRVNLLLQADFLHAIRLASLSGTGSGKLFLTVGPEGKALLAEAMGLHPAELHQQSRTKTPHIGAHHLSIGDFRLSLLLATEDSHGAVELSAWVSEPELRAERREQKTKNDPRAELPIPDAEFTLTLADGSSQGFRLECDLTGSTSTARFQKKLRDYLRLAHLDDRPVLWVAPSTTRADVIASWCMEAANEAKGDPTLFWICPRGMITEETILRPIWREVGGPGELVGLIPAVPDAPLPLIESQRTPDHIHGGFPWTQ